MSGSRDSDEVAHLVDAEPAVVVEERPAFEDAHRADVHRVLEPLQVQEAGVERGQPVVACSSDRDRRAARSLRSTAMTRTSTTVWTISPELVLALDEQLGPPVDSYVNGSQTWLVGDDATTSRSNAGCIRSPGTGRPRRCSHYDIWEAVVAQLSRRRRSARAAPRRRSPAARRVCGTGSSASPPTATTSSRAQLAALATAALGRPPDRSRPRRPRMRSATRGNARTATSRSSRCCSNS